MADIARKVAHELRNLLGLIALEVHAASAAAGDPDATRRSLAEIDALVTKCSDAVAELEAGATTSGAREGRART